MSYILEALRKSEQERQRGKVPDLNSYKEESVAPALPRHRWPWVIGGIVLVNLLVVLFWWSPWKHGDTAVVPALPAATPVVATPAAGTPSSLPASAGAASAGQASPVQPVPVQAGVPQGQVQPLQTPAPQYAPPPQQVPPSGYGQPAYGQPAVPQGYVQQGYPPPQAYGSSGYPPPGYPQQAGYPPQGYPQQNYPPAQNYPPQGYSQNVTLVSPSVQPQATQVSPATEGEQYIEPYSADFPDSADEGRSPSVAYLPQLEELPPGERAAIPDMTFSSHMYSSMPRFRSIIINGKRLKEGEYLNDTLQVREITDKGVIMSNGSTLFSVDVLGRWAQ